MPGLVVCAWSKPEEARLLLPTGSGSSSSATTGETRADWIANRMENEMVRVDWRGENSDWRKLKTAATLENVE